MDPIHDINAFVDDLLESEWDRAFAFLLQFAQREGHSSPSKNHIEDEFRLAQWVSQQVQEYKSGSLSPDKISKLENLPGWAWIITEFTGQKTWDESFDLLRLYTGREGQARPPTSHIEDGYTLGKWVNNQRTDYRKDSLSPDKIYKLENLPSWVWRAV